MSRPSAAHQPPLPDPSNVPAMRRALLGHYDRTARDLPWRGETDPYRIWVSEMMLQQTRVDTVLSYYGRWVERFPDVASLAAAEEDEVLLAWEGLGYYRRARFLHAGARLVRETMDGQVPDSYEGLRQIPGLGEYAAGAVASIAFGEVVPAVDGNVRRVLARLYDVARPTGAWLRRTAAVLVDPERPGDWNQAMMELGATVCTPRSPECGGCPLARWCDARRAGTQAERPAPSTSRAVPRREFGVAVAVDEEGRALMERRPSGGLLGGMWSFPETALADGERVEDVAVRAAASLGLGVDPSEARPLPPVRHRFSHFAATYHPMLLPASALHDEDRRRRGPGSRWRPLADPGVALPVAQRKIARHALAEWHRGRSRPSSSEIL